MNHYLMYPDIHKESFVFVTEDDLWLYDGNLKRITEGLGIVRYPKFSCNGKYIAFSVFKSMGREDLKPQGDIFLYSIEKNYLKRLTYYGSKDIKVIGWYGGKIYFSSSHSSPLNYYPEIYRMNPDGTEFEKLPYGNASYIGFGTNFILLGRNIGDPAKWKRYRGGTVGQLWISKDGKKFERIMENLEGNIGSPMIVNDKICFISDHEGIGRIYCLDGEKLIRMTENSEYYVRNANTDGMNIIFQMAGEIYTLNNGMRKLNIDVYGTKRLLQERYIENVPEKIESFSLNENGERIIFTVRGKLFNMESFSGPVITTQNIRLLNGVYLKGEEYIGVLNSEGKEHVVLLKEGKIIKRFEKDLGLILNIWPSPNGESIIISTGRLELYLLNLKNDEFKNIDVSKTGPIKYLDFSPNGKWIAYSIALGNNRIKIRIRNIENNEFSDIESTYRFDFSPSFDPFGRYLYFISLSSFKAIEDPAIPSLTFPNPSKIFLVTLRKNFTDPFISKMEGEVKDFAIDLDGISERIIPFPLKEGRYISLYGVKDGIVYMSMPLSMEEENVGELHYYNINEKKDELLVDKASRYTISLDRTKIAYMYHDLFRIVDSTQKKETKSNIPGRESGIVDLKRIKLFSYPKEEFKQIFYETWFMMKENYWKDENIKWDEIFNKYLPLLEKISTRSELSDLIWELQGELGTSHSYEYLGDYFNSPLETRGYLGAEIEYKNEYKIKKIYRGRLDEKSPLISPGLEIKEGDVIISINGIDLDAKNPPGKILTNMVDDIISIKIKRNDNIYTYNLKTLSDESMVIYRDWVEKNKNYVHSKTNGKVGYVHIPDMMNFGFAEFHKNFLEEVDRDALIIDVRYNRGGFVSPFLLEKLNRKIIGFEYPRHGLREEYPPASPKGPIVCITNELSGSDGDIFSHSFKLMKLGPLIGKRTWGGVIGINPKRKLIDGSIVTQPEYAFWFKGVGFGIENRGTEPDIEVEITPLDFSENRDPQLDKAIEVVLEKLKNEK
ncbi:MAG: S41 family peptidase [Thermoplasmata archaeon]